MITLEEATNEQLVEELVNRYSFIGVVAYILGEETHAIAPGQRLNGQILRWRAGRVSDPAEIMLLAVKAINEC